MCASEENRSDLIDTVVTDVCYCCCYFLYTHCLAYCKNKHLTRKNNCLFLVVIVIVSSWQGEISELVFVYACVLLCRLETLLVSLIQIYHEVKQSCFTYLLVLIYCS